MTTDETFECIIIGGGVAGLSAALVLGRARRRTLLLDAGHQSNLAAHGVGGLLGHDRQPPAALYARGREELAAYPSVVVRAAEVTSATRVDGTAFAVETVAGDWASARRLLLAGGMEYRYPALPGMSERWGDSVFHCPFCHGWEVRDRPLAVLNAGDAGVHQALLLRAWSDDVTLLCGSAGVDDDARERLRTAGVRIEEREPTALRGPGRELEAVELADGGELAVQAVLVATTLHQRSSLAADLGVAFADPNPMTAEAIAVDGMQRTTVSGVYAAGDVLSGPPSVAAAIASGHFAGAMVVAGLMEHAPAAHPA